jgi:hypothetical protein
VAANDDFTARVTAADEAIPCKAWRRVTFMMDAKDRLNGMEGAADKSMRC